MATQSYYKEKSRQLLTFYFRLIAERAGIQWTQDNYSEIGELVDCLIKAAQAVAAPAPATEGKEQDAV